MDEQFFVRIRGRVQGPYDADKLRSLVRRGQVSRMHEVSRDKVAWRQAADFPELFASPEVRQSTARGTAAVGGTGTVAGPDVEADGEIQLVDEKEWYYAKNNVQSGPVTFEHLKALTQAGAVAGDDLVWKAGMTDWKPAWQIQGLHTIPLIATQDPRSARSSDRLEGEIIRTMTDAKGWAGCVSICVNTFGILIILLSLLVFLFGVRKGAVADTASGLFGILWGSLVVTAGILLAKYNGHVRKFLHVRTATTLDAAMRSLKALWIYLSIVLLLVLLNSAALAIWGFSAGLVSLR